MPRTTKKTTAPIEKHTIPTVPVAEQPYKVPENWRWVRLGSIIKLISGRDATLSECNDIGIGIPYILGASNIENNKFMIERWIEKPIVVSNKGDILLSVKGTIGKLYIQTEDKINISRQIMAIHPYDMCNTRYAYYFLSSICDKLKEAGNGLIPGISRKDILDSIFPLPPLAEQQRIVDRIESLFAKLDEAREKAQAVVDGFENRKAAILHKAFTGELTKKWREERGIGIESWKTVHLEDVCNSIFDGDHMPPPKSERGIPFLVISNVNDGYLSYDNTRFVPHDYYEALSDTRKPKIGDLLYTLVGSYGIPVVVDNNRPFCFQRHMALLKPSNIDTYFLWYQMQTNEVYNQATNIATGTAQLTVPIKGLRKLKINFPIHDEQSEIVRLLDSFLTQDRRARDLAESVIAQIDVMKKAILARAFRGELGTNVPEEAACEV